MAAIDSSSPPVADRRFNGDRVSDPRDGSPSDENRRFDSASGFTVRLDWPVPVALSRSLVDFERRSFHLGAPSTRSRLEGCAAAFIDGCNLASSSWPDPHPNLAAVDHRLRGFAYEGAGLSARIGVLLRRPGAKTFLQTLMSGPGRRYPHLIHVGYGWSPVIGRLQLPGAPPPTGLLRWLTFDGAGFATTFFTSGDALGRLARSADDPVTQIRLAGAGRALWFVNCADPGRLALAIGGVDRRGRDALWSGVGLAMAYAGGSDERQALQTVDASGSSRAHLAQGVAFAVTASELAGTTSLLGRALVAELFGDDESNVAGEVNEMASDLLHRPDVAAYHEWRARIRKMVV